MHKTREELAAEDFVVHQLKKKFLILAPAENYPKTPDVTKQLDYLLKTIRELEEENMENLQDK